MSEYYPGRSHLVAGSLAAAIGLSTALGACSEAPAVPEPLAMIESQEDIRLATIAYIGSISCMLSAESTGADTVFDGASLDNDVFGPDADGDVPEDYRQPVVARATRQPGGSTILFTAGPGRDFNGSAPSVSLQIGILNGHRLATEPITKDQVAQPLQETEFDPLNLTVTDVDGTIAASIIDDRGRLTTHEDGNPLTEDEIVDWSSRTAAALEYLADDAGLPECHPKLK